MQNSFPILKYFQMVISQVEIDNFRIAELLCPMKMLVVNLTRCQEA
jgi:hypothetical protein